MPSCAMVCDDEFVFYRIEQYRTEFLCEMIFENLVHEGNEIFKV